MFVEFYGIADKVGEQCDFPSVREFRGMDLDLDREKLCIWISYEAHYNENRCNRIKVYESEDHVTVSKVYRYILAKLKKAPTNSLILIPRVEDMKKMLAKRDMIASVEKEFEI